MDRGKVGRAIEENETNLLELLDGSLVDTTALVDQVTGLSSMLAQVHVESTPPCQSGVEIRLYLQWSTCQSRRGR
jgi:hypothetical protein